VGKRLLGVASRKCVGSYVISVEQLLANNRTPVSQHPLYSPDLVPCDF